MTGERQEGFVTVNGVSTLVCTWGGWLEENINHCKEVIVFFPGNPGIIGFYDTFLSKLHSELEIPVWAVSFAGHALPPSGLNPGMPSLEENNHLYDLQGQIKHKSEFLEKFVPEGVQVTIAAHSIGALLTVEALKNKTVREKVKKAYLLFPALERLLQAPNANAIWIKYPNFFMTFTVTTAWLFNLLPLILRKLIVSSYLKIQGTPTEHTLPLIQYAQLPVLRSVAFLAYDKMYKVRELDSDAMKQLSDILFLYYGAKDGWVPLTFWKEMKEKLPEVKSVVCEHGFEHAFCLNSGEEMADILADLIREKPIKE